MSQSLPDLLEDLTKVVIDERHYGYLRQPIPSALDDMVVTLIRSYQESDEDEQGLIECLPQEAASVLLVFAERQAACAVRTRRFGALTEAAMAIGLAASVGRDEREGMVVMPVVWHAAALLGVHQSHLFNSTASKLPQAGARALSAFAARKAEDQTLECMGYRTEDGRDGFRYVRTW